MRGALALVRGTYGIAVVDARAPDRIVVARNGSPVIIGIGEHEMFVASDVAALVRYTRQVVHLDDGEIAVLDTEGFHTTAMDERPVPKSPSTVECGKTAPTSAAGTRTTCTRRSSTSPRRSRAR